MATQKVLRVGNSLGVTLPSGLVKNISLKVGDQVEITQQLDNSLTLVFIDNHQLSFNLSSPKKTLKKEL